MTSTDAHQNAYAITTGMIRRTAAIGKAPMDVWAASADHLVKSEKRSDLAAALAFACAEFHAVCKAMNYRAPKVIDRVRERVQAYNDESVNLDAELAMQQIESLIAAYDREPM